jgi:hypothetical protein
VPNKDAVVVMAGVMVVVMAVVVAALSKRVRNSGHSETLVDVGSRVGHRQAQGVYGSHECADLEFCDPRKSLAPWHERKHPSAPAAILPARNRRVLHLSRAAKSSSTRSSCSELTGFQSQRVNQANVASTV